MRALALAIALVPVLALAQGRRGGEPQARYLAPLATGVRIGGLAAYATAGGGTAAAFGGGAYAMFDAQSLLADVAVDAYGGEDAAMLSGGLGVYWAAFPGDNLTPYLGGSARLGWTRFGGEGAFGLQLVPAVGLLASRHWSPQVRLELAWFFDVAGERPRGGGAETRANGLIATIGLGF